MQTLERILIGAFAGACIAGGSYAKNRKKEDFDDIRFFSTILIGAVAGVASSVLGGSTETWYDKASLFLQSSGLAVQLEIWIKAGKRRLRW